MSQYKPYPAYKDSGVEWLGKVPEHWNIERVRQRYHLRNGYPFNSSLFQPEGEAENRLIRIRDLTPTDAFIYTEEACTDNALIGNGDVLIGMDGDFNAVLWNEGRAKLNQRVCALRGATVAQTKYFLYSIPMVLGIINNTAYATTVKHLSSGEVMSAKLAFPPQKELGKIVEILDRETARIDSLVAAKTRFIELLKEKRQALITRAVTKGLDSTVKMKDSGVEWLGQVPEHWEISAIKHWFTTTSGGTPDTKQQDRFYTEDGGTPWIRTTDLNNGRLDEFEISITDDAIKETACSIVPCGSVLVAMYGGAGTIGKNALLKIDACINQALCALLPNRFFDDEYTFLYVQFYKPYWMIDAESSRKDPNINQDLVKNAKIMRPSINEQHDIVEYINRKTTRIDALIDKTQRSIELLKERRSALITAAVAGKIDLREAAV